MHLLSFGIRNVSSTGNCDTHVLFEFATNMLFDFHSSTEMHIEVFFSFRNPSSLPSLIRITFIFYSFYL